MQARSCRRKRRRSSCSSKSRTARLRRRRSRPRRRTPRRRRQSEGALRRILPVALFWDLCGYRGQGGGKQRFQRCVRNYLFARLAYEPLLATLCSGYLLHRFYACTPAFQMLEATLHPTPGIVPPCPPRLRSRLVRGDRPTAPNLCSSRRCLSRRPCYALKSLVECCHGRRQRDLDWLPRPRNAAARPDAIAGRRRPQLATAQYRLAGLWGLYGGHGRRLGLADLAASVVFLASEGAAACRAPALHADHL